MSLELAHLSQRLAQRFQKRLWTIDSHTAGEQTRLIVGGVGPLPGRTIKEKRDFLMERRDDLRRLLCTEPRSGSDLMAALVTEPETPGASFGLIFMDGRRYPYGCGTATIGAVKTLIEAGAIEAREPATRVVVDTPGGPMETTAFLEGGRVASVALDFVPSFVQGQGESLEVPGLGRIQVDTVCVGGFFVMVSSDQIGLDLTPANGPRLVELGMRLIDLANEQLRVSHPLREEVKTVDVVQFYDTSGHARGRGLGAVVYGESHLDRSPCGTGTAAKLTLLHRRGQIGLGQPFVNAGVLGSTFEARLKAETDLSGVPAVVVEVRGSAQITGLHQFVVEPGDPFPQGFLI